MDNDSIVTDLHPKPVSAGTVAAPPTDAEGILKAVTGYTSEEIAQKQLDKLKTTQPQLFDSSGNVIQSEMDKYNQQNIANYELNKANALKMMNDTDPNATVPDTGATGTGTTGTTGTGTTGTTGTGTTTP
jgi:hypothetical protein